MELPRGITGFRHVKDLPLQSCDGRVFRRHCYAAAHALNGRVVTVEDPFCGGTANFARALLELPTGQVAVLLNAYFPVIALAEPPVDWEARVQFADVPELAEALREFGMYEVMDLSELTAPLTPEHCERLARAELEQIKYWCPQSVGEVVFNYWD